MNEVVLNTLEKINKIFLKFGIRSVTMDDIARELGVSKKTLYQQFSDKNDIVKKIVIYNLNQQEQGCMGVTSTSGNAIDCMLGINEMLNKMYTPMTNSLLYDLKKYHPEAMELVDSFKNEFVRKQISTNIERGKKEGLYRKELNTETITGLYLCLSDSVFGNTYFPPEKYSYPMIGQAQIEYHLYAIVSDKGRKYLNEKLNQNL